MCIQILMLTQTAHTMETSHLDINMKFNLILDINNLFIFYQALYLLPYPFLVSKCDVTIVRAVWLLFNIWMYIKHTSIFVFNRKKSHFHQLSSMKISTFWNIMKLISGLLLAQKLQFHEVVSDEHTWIYVVKSKKSACSMKHGNILVSNIKLQVTLVSKCHVSMIWEVW